MLTKEHYIENEFVELWVEGGIIHQVFRPHLRAFDIVMAKKIVQDRSRLYHQVKKPLFVDLRNMTSIDKETRKYFASEEAFYDLSASAFLITDRSGARIMATLFLSFKKPALPTRVFNSKEKALKWLKDYK